MNPGLGYLSLQRIGVLDFTENRQRLLTHIIVAPKSQGDSRSWLEILRTLTIAEGIYHWFDNAM